MLLVRRVHSLSFPLVAAAACWGVAAVVSKRAVEEIPPLTLLPLQLVVSVTVLTALVHTTERAPLQPSMRRRAAALGVLNPGLAYALSLAGLTQVSASVSVLLWAVEPLLIIALARVLLDERITRPHAIAAIAAVAGVTLVIFQPGAQLTAVGVTLTLAGVAACAVYTVATSRVVAIDDPVTVVAIQQRAALIFAVGLFVISLVRGDGPSLGDISPAAWLSAVVAGALYYGVAFVFYLTGLRVVRPAVAGMYINLVPLFGLAASRILLDESLTLRQWLGAAVIIGAVVAIGRLQDARQPIRR